MVVEVKGRTFEIIQKDAVKLPQSLDVFRDLGEQEHKAECIRFFLPLDPELKRLIYENKRIRDHIANAVFQAIANDQNWKLKARCFLVVDRAEDAALYASLIALIARGAMVIVTQDSRTGKPLYFVYTHGYIYYGGE